MKVMIATPCYDGRVDTLYAASLVATMMSKPADMVIEPVFLVGSALICHARNVLLGMALDKDIDAIMWIDSDIGWKPADFFRLLASDELFIGGMARVKQPELNYSVRLSEGRVEPRTGIHEATGLGCGFTKMDKVVARALWDASPPYDYRGTTYHFVYATSINDRGQFVGEDYYACDTWRTLGGHLYVDTDVVLDHVSNREVYQIA